MEVIPTNRQLPRSGFSVFIEILRQPEMGLAGHPFPLLSPERPTSQASTVQPGQVS
jgi:hypothetical protein